MMERLHCSIEMEPRTLNQGQLSHAREEAVKVVQKKDPNEALNIFTEGMKPIVSIESMKNEIERKVEIMKLIEKMEGPDGIKRSWNEPPGSCCSDHSPEDSKIVEPLTAPF
ncbi:hypothetical protein AMTRI_Chr05g57900 [Amborella trichopoda]|uniref:uncharacterized protein LOC105421350 n=1 Tax=Amborella trichopoda TaxID=13333 RepID=UPI0005D35AF1|nr:uncharacterized protein LOC105421350 [Amborella trichopoda]|eukprot:XP_011626724.1 uncharacterized protein LOC105421350 [Amborella trichopoda]